MPSYIPELFNTDPYYDDFNENKKFLRIMFRPGYGVQARELTQIQTLLQNQIERFGGHVFEEGSMVLDGKITVNSLQYARVEGLSGTSDIADFIGTVIGSPDRASGKIVYAEMGYTSSSVDNIPVIFYEYLEGGTGFVWGDMIGGTAPNGTYITASLTGATSGSLPSVGGNALVVSVDRGVRFVEGFFVLNDRQSMGSYSLSGDVGGEVRVYENPTTRLGFDVNKTFMQSEEDGTLNDPAFGSYNYNAPGADRFLIDLNLSQKTFDPTDTSTTDNFARKDFIEFLRLVDGSPIKIEKYPDYAALEDTLARRTYDESGNYTVRPFEVNLQNGPGATSDGTTGNLLAELEPGKAYVFGYEFETQGITRLPLSVARGDDHVRTIDDKYFNRSLGPYCRVQFSEMSASLTAHVGLEEEQTVYISRGATGTAQNQIGTARLRWIEPYNASVYNLHLFNVEMSGTASFDEATRLFLSATGSTHAFSLTGSDGLINLQSGNLLYEFPTGTRGKTVSDASYAIGGFFEVTIGAGAFSTMGIVGGNGVSQGTLNVTDYTLSSTDVSFSVPADYTSLPDGDIMAFNRNGVAIGGTAFRASAQQLDLTLSGNGVTNGEKIFVVASIDVNSVAFPHSRRNKTKITEEITYGAAGFTGTFQGLTSDQYGNTVLYLAGKVDVVEVLSITGTKDTPIQLSQYFAFDSGMRDNLYDWSRLVLSVGVTGVMGPYQATVVRYEREGDRGPFTVDSYPSPYSDITTYISKTTGKSYDLADVIDFRPDRGPSGNIVGNPWFPINTAANDQLFSYQHYLSRTDKIVLTRDRAFNVIKGIPSLDGQTPPDDPNAMTLYTVTMNPYTFNAKDTSIRFVENKRYTMRDIGELEKRIEAVEYYTTLTLLEQEAKSLSIVDASNIEIPKKGILVDQFKGHNIGDVTNSMYASAVDFERNELRPAFASRVFGLTGPIGTIGLTASGDGILTLQYTTSADIAQPLATTSLTINPSSVFNYLGSLSLSPAGDYWFDSGITPSVKVNVDGENDAWQSGEGFGSQWNDWESLWYGREIASEANTKQNSPTKNSIVAGTKGLSLGNTFKSGVPEGIKRKSASKIINKNVVPFMRDQEITMNAKGLKPNTKFYVFVDDLDITAFCTGGSQITSAKGEVSNLRYLMNQDTENDLLTGRRVFRITDSITNTPSNTTMAADAIFNSAGSIDALAEDNILATRSAEIRRRTVKSNKVQSNLIELLSTDFFGFTEPLSQTFYVDPVKYPDGIYVKKIGIAFSAKDTNGNTPVMVMLKPTLSGYPHPSKILPFGQSTVYAEDITTSEDGSIETLFSFSSPIYLLSGNEYAVSLITNSSSFAVLGATIGNEIIRLSEGEITKKATKQPAIRSLFLPQNSGSLTKKDTDCLKFSVHLCKFSPQSGNMTYENSREAYATDTNFDVMRLNVNHITPSNTTVNVSERGLVGDIGGSFVSSQPNKNIDRPTNRSNRTKTAASKFSEVTINMVGNSYVSPVVDLQTSHYTVISNQINNNSVLGTNNELFPTNLGATAPSEARYITKQVTLEPGFEATDIHVQMSLCNPYESSIQVFIRPLPVGESDHSSIGYTQLTANDSGYSQNTDDFREVSFTTSTSLSKFRAFAIKIVMYSTCASVPSDPRALPRIKNLRVVAT